MRDGRTSPPRSEGADAKSQEDDEAVLSRRTALEEEEGRGGNQVTMGQGGYAAAEDQAQGGSENQGVREAIPRLADAPEGERSGGKKREQENEVVPCVRGSLGGEGPVAVVLKLQCGIARVLRGHLGTNSISLIKTRPGNTDTKCALVKSRGTRGKRGQWYGWRVKGYTEDSGRIPIY